MENLLIFLRIENASHILLWAARDHDNEGKDKKTIELHSRLETIELPRLHLRFTTGFDESGNLRIYSNEHSGLHILTEKVTDANLEKLAGVMPFSLLLADADEGRYILLPNCPYDARAEFKCNLGCRNYTVRNDKKWLEEFDVRVYIYKLHESFLFLKMPSLEASLLWAYLCSVIVVMRNVQG